MTASRLKKLAMATVAAASLVLIPIPANASVTTEANDQITLQEAERALDTIQEQTSGTDGRFDYTSLVNAGVPEPILIQYAGVLEAAGQSYKAPASKQELINDASADIELSVHAASTRAGVSPASFDWSDVLRVAGSYVECMAYRTIYLGWYPLAGCVPNPDGNGTWLLVIIY
ncbi:hypothetical protein ACSAGD_02905 [Paramicrobacterium sp. CJ85]|uniref:hypothetical protein n=1 Tax=Paramicrobacterium sp. CJ85 TaxID=3445355 RepID=UPI003F5F948C